MAQLGSRAPPSQSLWRRRQRFPDWLSQGHVTVGRHGSSLGLVCGVGLLDAGRVFWMQAMEEILQAAALASEHLRKWPGAAFEGFDFPQALVATKAPWVWGGVVSLSTRRILVQPEQRLPASCLVLGNGLASFSCRVPQTRYQPSASGHPKRGAVTGPQGALGPGFLPSIRGGGRRARW